MDVDALGVFASPQLIPASTEEFFWRQADDALSDTQIATVIGSALARRLARVNDLYLQSALSLSALRQLQAETQKAFTALEKFAYHNVLVRPETRWSSRADKPMKMDDGNIGIQRLPCLAYGLCRIALHLAQPLPRDGQIHVSLMLAEGNIAQEWDVYGPRPAGMIWLMLPPSPDEARQPWLQLKGTGAGICLSLNNSWVGPGLALQVDGNSLEQALAMTLQFAPVGVDLPARRGAVQPRTGAADDRSDAVIVLVDDWRLATFRKARSPQGQLIELIDDGMLQIHPSVAGMTVASLDDLDLAGATRLRADILLAHVDAPRVAFALAVLPRGGKLPRKHLEDPSLSWALCNSGWLELGGGERASLCVTLDTDLQEASVYLITILRDTRADYGWARWGQLYLEF